jgi:hypothetical protein
MRASIDIQCLWPCGVLDVWLQMLVPARLREYEVGLLLIPRVQEHVGGLCWMRVPAQSLGRAKQTRLGREVRRCVVVWEELCWAVND